MSDLDPRERRVFDAAWQATPVDEAGLRERLAGRLAGEKSAMSPPASRRAAWPFAPLVLSPWRAGGAALGVFALGAALAWVARTPPAAPPGRVGPETRVAAMSVVHFELVAPEASSVALVGDFNGWNPAASPMRRTGDAWTLAVPVASGRHVYAFVLDGVRWVSDPGAPLAPENEYGFKNSVLVVSGREAS